MVITTINIVAVIIVILAGIQAYLGYRVHRGYEKVLDLLEKVKELEVKTQLRLDGIQRFKLKENK